MKVPPGGARTRSAVCHPAPSSTRSSRLRSLKPCSSTNACSVAAKISALSWGTIQNEVRPLSGCTKATRYSHSYRGRTTARGRLPRGAQTRRRMGISPTRCSSIAQSSISASGCAPSSRATCPRSSCLKCLLGLRIRVGVPGPRHLRRLPHPPQILPSALGRHASAHLPAQPAGDLRTAPQSAAGRASSQRFSQRALPILRKQRAPARVATAPVQNRLRSASIVPDHQLPDPVHRVARGGRHLFASLALGDQPQPLPVRLLRRVAGPAVTLLQLLRAQMTFHADSAAAHVVAPEEV